jgi:hypothetical protein
MKRHLLAVSVLSAAVAMGLAGQTAAQTTTTTATTTTTTVETTRLTTSYTTLAGSADNAQALVNGLRGGSSIALVTPATATAPAVQTTFTPATGPMGWGNVNIALSLAQAELTKAGIANPTAADLQAALNGGTITTPTGSVQLSGVLALRASGEGWGQIANSLGFKLGEIMGQAKGRGPLPSSQDIAHGEKGQAQKADKLAKADKADKAEKAEKVEKFEKVEKVEKANRPDKPERPEKAERPDKPERGGR